MTCPLCNEQGERRVWQDAYCRVIVVDDVDYPGFCRVIWNTHSKEMTDLTADEQAHFMNRVFAVEAVLRELLHPAKINLASLGNQTPHLHWHVIPRYSDDAHFPNSIWSARMRDGAARVAPALDVLQSKLRERLG